LPFARDFLCDEFEIAHNGQVCAAISPGEQRGISMLSWLGGRGERARAKRVEAEADRLVRDYGEQAHSIARLREDEASSVQMAQEWIRIARAVSCRTQERVVLSTGRDCLMLNRSAALILSRSVPLPVPSLMSRVRSAAQAIKTSKPGERKDAASLLPRWIPPQLCQPAQIAPPGPQ
jgi:hypothetical protein